MDWELINITKFDGLNSEVASELLNDEVGTARDLLNYRPEKIGKLDSRNGYIFGLQTGFKPIDEEDALEPQVENFLANNGIIGMNEYVSSQFLPGLDTDRFMVYFVRGVSDQDDRNKLCILIAPETGRHANKLLVSDNLPTPFYCDLSITRSESPKLDGTPVTLYAPNRVIPTDPTTDPDITQGVINDDWIKHYIGTTQFKRKLLIADRKNGMLILEDAYDDGEAKQGTTVDHQLRLRPAFKESFNIDIVSLDSRRLDGEENHSFENGMALYGYTLDKSYMKGTVSHNDNMINNPEWLAEDGDITKAQDVGNHAILDKILNYFSSTHSQNTFMTAVSLFDYTAFKSAIDGEGYIGFLLKVNQQKNYVFTDADIPGQEYADVIKPLVLPKEKYLDTKGNYLTSYYTNSYIWNDLPLTYYPCTATGMDEYLTQVARFFDKLAPGVRGIELTTLDKYGRTVPLSVWGYKYVWEFENGEYSAPSTPIMCPDQLFSATQDTVPAYHRKMEITGIDRSTADLSEPNGLDFTTSVISKAGSPYPGQVIKYGGLFGANITQLGRLFYNIKEKLYKDMNNRYGIGNISSFDDFQALFDNQSPDNLILLGNFGCLITADFGQGNRITKNGNIFEGVVCPCGNEWSDAFNFGLISATWEATDWWGLYFDRHIHVTSQPLTIPIFQDINDVRTYNSLFDDEGRLRIAWLELPNLANRPQFQLLMRLNTVTGLLKHIFTEEVYINQIVPDAYNQIFLNIVSQRKTTSPYTDYDLNNEYNGVYVDPITQTSTDLDILRPDTLLRAVKSEQDKLTNYRSDVDAEAFSRLVLKGWVGIDIVNQGDDVYGYNNYDAVFDNTHYATAYAFNKNVEKARLAYTVPRSYDVKDKLLIKTSGITSPGNQPRLFGNETFLDQVNHPIHNLAVTTYGEAERFIGIEQLTSYFPASLLTESPRMAIKIPNDKIPPRAKKLFIYRTIASHNNNFDPTIYGLVEAVDIVRNDQGEVDMNSTGGFYYFDKIKDSAIDFSAVSSEYDGITMLENGEMPVKSRFVTKVGERAVAANLEISYQPASVRGFMGGNFGEFTNFAGVSSLNLMSLDIGWSMMPVTDSDVGF